ncbi:MAG: hypothetical protein ACPGXK_10740 [Phycisphaerae bacterium]
MATGLGDGSGVTLRHPTARVHVGIYARAYELIGIDRAKLVGGKCVSPDGGWAARMFHLIGVCDFVWWSRSCDRVLFGGSEYEIESGSENVSELATAHWCYVYGWFVHEGFFYWGFVHWWFVHWRHVDVSISLAGCVFGHAGCGRSAIGHEGIRRSRSADVD